MQRWNRALEINLDRLLDTLLLAWACRYTFKIEFHFLNPIQMCKPFFWPPWIAAIIARADGFARFSASVCCVKAENGRQEEQFQGHGTIPCFWSPCIQHGFRRSSLPWGMHPGLSAVVWRMHTKRSQQQQQKTQQRQQRQNNSLPDPGNWHFLWGLWSFQVGRPLYVASNPAWCNVCTSALRTPEERLPRGPRSRIWPDDLWKKSLLGNRTIVRWTPSAGAPGTCEALCILDYHCSSASL